MVISNFVFTFIPYIFYAQSKSLPCQSETFNFLYLWKNLYIYNWCIPFNDQTKDKHTNSHVTYRLVILEIE